MFSTIRPWPRKRLNFRTVVDLNVISGDWSLDPPASPGQVAAAIVLLRGRTSGKKRAHLERVGIAPDWPFQPRPQGRGIGHPEK